MGQLLLVHRHQGMRDHRHLLLVLLLHRPQSLPTRHCPLGSEGWRFQMGQQLPEALLQMHPSHLSGETRLAGWQMDLQAPERLELQRLELQQRMA